MQCLGPCKSQLRRCSRDLVLYTSFDVNGHSSRVIQRQVELWSLPLALAWLPEGTGGEKESSPHLRINTPALTACDCLGRSHDLGACQQLFVKAERVTTAHA
jgi:hypothetical protein